MEDSTLVFLHAATIKGYRWSEWFSNKAWVPVAEMHGPFHFEKLSKDNFDFIQEQISNQGYWGYLLVVTTLSS